jgi:hypothetical protein
LKYYNNNFLLDIIRTEDFTLNSILGSQKIKKNNVDISKIENFGTFFVNQTKFLYKDNQIQKIIASSTEGLNNLIDINTSFFLIPQKFTDYLDVDTAVGAWFDYIKKNKFSVQKKIESYINIVADNSTLLNKIKRGVALVESTGCPVNTISPKSVTDITIAYDNFTNDPLLPNNNYTGKVISGMHLTENNQKVEFKKYVQPITSIEWYFHKMLWGEKQIKSRIFHSSYQFQLFYNNTGYYNWTYEAVYHGGYESFSPILKSTPSPFNYQIRHNYHIADGCFEPRHFCDNSISLNSIAKNNNAKILLSKFNRAFLTRLGI